MEKKISDLQISDKFIFKEHASEENPEIYEVTGLQGTLVVACSISNKNICIYNSPIIIIVPIND